MKKSSTRGAGAQGKPEVKRVWRISERAPQGEWVDSGDADDKGAAPAATNPVPEDVHGSWLESTMDLLNGVEVRHGNDTMPGELFGDFEPTRPQRD